MVDSAPLPTGLVIIGQRAYTMTQHRSPSPGMLHATSVWYVNPAVCNKSNIDGTFKKIKSRFRQAAVEHFYFDSLNYFGESECISKFTYSLGDALRD